MAVWQNYGNEAIRSLYPRLRDGVDYFWGKVNPDDLPSLIGLAYGVEINLAAVQARANRIMGMNPNIDYTPNPDTAPKLTGLVPNSAPVGSAAFTLRALGSGFTPESVIVWNNGDENTTFVSESEVTTGVDPTTASGPVSIPVQVKNGDRAISASQIFTFTPAEPPPDTFVPE